MKASIIWATPIMEQRPSDAIAQAKGSCEALLLNHELNVCLHHLLECASMPRCNPLHPLPNPNSGHQIHRSSTCPDMAQEKKGAGERRGGWGVIPRKPDTLNATIDWKPLHGQTKYVQMRASMITRHMLWLPALHDSHELINKPPNMDAMLFWLMPKDHVGRPQGYLKKARQPRRFASNGQHYKAKPAMAVQSTTCTTSCIPTFVDIATPLSRVSCHAAHKSNMRLT